jgi:hypothetical protein
VGGLTALALVAGLRGDPDGPLARVRDRGLPLLLALALDEAPPDAVALVVSDSAAAGLAFAQVAEGARPDVAVLVRQHLWDASSVGPVWRRLPHALAGWRPGTDAAALLAQLAPSPAPPHLRWEWGGVGALEVPPEGVSPRGWLFGGGPPHAGLALAPLQRVVEAVGPTGLADGQARRGLASPAMDLGAYALASGDSSGASAAFAVACALWPDGHAAWTNRGQALARAGDLAGALEAARRAHALSDSPTTGQNLARLLLSVAPDDAALPALLDGLVGWGEAAQRAAAYGLRGVLRGNRGDLAGAAADFAAALELDPLQSEARAGRSRLSPP